jgi:ketosteroid isomerase-like protein
VSTTQSAGEIRRVAKVLDDAVERKDIELILSCFQDDGEVEVSGLTFKGKEDIRKAIDWMYQTFGTIQFQPIVILVDENVFFEEFVLCATPDGREFQIKAAEVLLYEDYKIAGLRLYFDRLEIARVLAKGFVERFVVDKLHQATLKGLA